MATTLGDLRDRISSLCASAPFAFVEAVQPFDFDKQPSGNIDEVFRITTEQGSVIGGFNFTEERTDVVQIWVARKQAGDPSAMYRLLLNDATSLRAAVIRDGAGAGDYAVPPEGGGISIDKDPGRDYAVLRLTLPLNFDAEL
jgi:hypothetical protein